MFNIFCPYNKFFNKLGNGVETTIFKWVLEEPDQTTWNKDSIGSAKYDIKIVLLVLTVSWSFFSWIRIRIFRIRIFPRSGSGLGKKSPIRKEGPGSETLKKSQCLTSLPSLWAAASPAWSPAASGSSVSGDTFWSGSSSPNSCNNKKNKQFGLVKRFDLLFLHVAWFCSVLSVMKLSSPNLITWAEVYILQCARA